MLDNQLCFRLYTASRLLTQAYHPLLQRMEKEGIILREKGKEDARQIIVTLTPKGKQLQEELGNVPLVIGNAVMCNSITPETVPELFKMLDDMIDRLSGNRCDSSGQPR